LQEAQADAQILMLDLSRAAMSAQQHANDNLSNLGAEMQQLSRAHATAMQEYRQLLSSLREVGMMCMLGHDPNKSSFVT
jgi:hypothetical protein